MKKFFVMLFMFLLMVGVSLAECPGGMVSYWTFDDADISASSLMDTIGNNDGSINGPVTGVQGIVGEAFDFQGSGDHVMVSDHHSLKGMQELAISFWFKPTSATDYWNSVLCKTSQSANNQQKTYCFGFRGEGVNSFLSFSVDTLENGHENVYTNTDEWNNEWYHITGVYDGNKLKIYVDGEKQNTNMHSGQVISDNVKLAIGKQDSDTNNYFIGKIDELAIFNMSLSETVIQRMYSASVEGNDYCSISPDLPLSGDFQNFPSTTNFSQVQNLSAVENLTLGSPHGTISFGNNTVNAENQDYNKNVIFGDCFVAVNATALDYSFNATAYLLMNNSDGHCGDDTIFVTSQVVADAGAIKNGSKICHNCKKVKIGEDTVTFRVPHFSSYAIGSNSNLTIDANDPQLVNSTVTFTAIYRNSSSGDFIEGANCEIELKGTTSAMSEGTEGYLYQTSFTENQTYSYNVTCNKAGYQQLKINDSFEILPTTEAVPEFNIIAILALIVIAGIFAWKYRKFI